MVEQQFHRPRLGVVAGHPRAPTETVIIVIQGELRGDRRNE
jgi:hypothetical protein